MATRPPTTASTPPNKHRFPTAVPIVPIAVIVVAAAAVAMGFTVVDMVMLVICVVRVDDGSLPGYMFLFFATAENSCLTVLSRLARKRSAKQADPQKHA